MAAAQLAHWLVRRMRRALKYDVHRQNRHEERMALRKFRLGKGDPEYVNFNPYRLNKRDAYYD